VKKKKLESLPTLSPEQLDSVTGGGGWVRSPPVAHAARPAIVRSDRLIPRAVVIGPPSSAVTDDHLAELDLGPLRLQGDAFPPLAVALLPSLTRSPLTHTFSVSPRASITMLFHSPSGFSELSVRFRMRRASFSVPPHF
jgi:hypothetical protein